MSHLLWIYADCKFNDFLVIKLLTHSYRKPVKGSLANSVDPDQTPHHVASDQGLQCLLTGFSIKNRIKPTKEI